MKVQSTTEEADVVTNLNFGRTKKVREGRKKK